MTIRDEDLRQKRLVFYQEHIEKFGEICVNLLAKSKAKAAMLVDKEGHLVSKQGKTEVDAETISALVAGSFAATQQIAKLLGEEEFSVLFHQGKKDSIQCAIVAKRMLLVVVFNNETTVGMVRLYADQAVKKLNAVIENLKDAPASAPTIGDDFSKSADKNLDEIFGEQQ